MPADNKSIQNFGAAIQPFTNAQIGRQFLIPVVPYGATLGRLASVDEKHIGKAPGAYSAKTGTWGGLGGPVLAIGATRRDHERWAPWPTENVGVLGVGYPGFDSDAESPVAAKLVTSALVRVFGKDFAAAERLRGNKGHRRLYAFEAYDQQKGVKSRRVVFTPKGDNKPSAVDIIGRGKQYVAAGRHPTGDRYYWHKDASLLDEKCSLERITDEDVNAFIDALKRVVIDQGGTMNSVSLPGGGGTIQEMEVSKLEPAMSIKDALHGLNCIPNSEENFPGRDDLVSILAAIRSALGSDADAAEDDIREWAVNSAFEPGWCDEEYFQKAWDSLGTVRVQQDMLERIFRRNGINHVSQAAFPDDDKEKIADTVKAAKESVASNRKDLLRTVAGALAFRDANTLENIMVPMVRDRMDVGVEIRAIDWWKHEALLSDPSLLARIQTEECYPPNRMGLANFLRDMRTERPDSFFDGTIMDPKAEQGDIVFREADGLKRRLLNVRRQSAACIFGKNQTKTPGRDKEDVETILTLMDRMFGAQLDYELDTLAYMAQTGERPGSLLFLVGDKGVGKSIYIEMLMYLFDGKSALGKGYVDGNKLANESSRRFVYASIEGCRIVSHRELPRNMNKTTISEMTATFKTMCDRGIGGDLIGIEGKGAAMRYIENVCRIIVSSNHHDAIEVEEGDRRIFYIDSGITKTNMFSEQFYAEFVDITEDAQRLAAFWRYLLNRDISKYSPYKSPPVTQEKLYRSIMSLKPTRRHFIAAIALLDASNRELTTNKELKELMYRMAVLERENSNGAIDDVFDYRTLSSKSSFSNPVAREITHCLRSQPSDKFSVYGKDVRALNQRVKVYALALGVKRKTFKWLEKSGSTALVEFIEDDIQQNKLVEHPFEMFREPIEEEDSDI